VKDYFKIMSYLVKKFQQSLRHRKCPPFEIIYTTNESLNDLKNNFEFFSKSDFEGFECNLVYEKLKDFIWGSSKCLHDHFVENIHSLSHLKHLRSNG